MKYTMPLCRATVAYGQRKGQSCLNTACCDPDVRGQHQFCYLHINSRECSICLCSNRSVTTNPRLPCGHPYHPKCIQAWLRRSWTCPVCRRPAYDIHKTIPVTETVPSSRFTAKLVPLLAKISRFVCRMTPELLGYVAGVGLVRATQHWWR